MRAYQRLHAEYKYTVEMQNHIIVPKEIRTWLLLKDSPFEESHVTFTHKGLNIIAFEYSEDAYYFIAWMEMLDMDYLEL